MTQYTKLSKNLISESYVPSQNISKINLNNNLNENRTPTSHTTVSGPKATKCVNDSVNLENLAVNLIDNNNKNNQKSNNNNQNGFSKPVLVSNFSSSNSFVMNKNERVKSSSVLRSNTIKYSKNNLDYSINYNQSNPIGNQTGNNYINNNFINKSVFHENNSFNDMNNSELNTSPRQTKKIFNKFSVINNSSNQQNISIDGSKRDFLTVLSSIHRASSINLGREKTNLSNYFSTSPNIYTKNFSNESMNSINNINSIIQQKNNINPNFKNSDSSLNQSSFNNNQNNVNVNNFKNRRHQTVSFRNSINFNNSYSKNYIETQTGNLNTNNYNLNENESKAFKHVSNSVTDKYNNNLEQNILLPSNEMQYSKFILNQSNSSEGPKLNNNLNSIKILDSNINLNLIKKKTSSLQSKKRSQKLETSELLNITLNENNDYIKDANNNINKNNKIDDLFEIEKSEMIIKQEHQIDNKDYLNYKEKDNQNQEQIKKRVDIDKELNSDNDETINKLPLNDKSQIDNVIKIKEAHCSKILGIDSKMVINMNNISKKKFINEENPDLIDLNQNNINSNSNIQKINKLEFNLEKFETIKKTNYFNNRENQINKNAKFNNKQFITTTVQPINHNTIPIANGQNSNFRINKSNLDLILIPQNVQSSSNHIIKSFENEKSSENLKNKLIRSNSKVSFVSRDINDSYAYTNVQQYIDENELMPPEKLQSIKKWIKDVNFWFDDWEKRTIELNIEES